jgi:large subunit ribosomal protein L29
MTFLKNDNLTFLTIEDLENKILLLSKELVDLRLKKVTRQSFKPHQFKHKKCQLSKLLTIKNLKKI